MLEIPVRPLFGDISPAGKMVPTELNTRRNNWLYIRLPPKNHKRITKPIQIDNNYTGGLDL